MDSRVHPVCGYRRTQPRADRGERLVISPIRTMLALAAAIAVTGPLPAISSTFTAGAITAIAPDDALNIRNGRAQTRRSSTLTSSMKPSA